MSFIDRLKGVFCKRCVQVIIDGVTAMVDPEHIKESSWVKRMHSGKLVGHDRNSLEFTSVGSSVVLKSADGKQHFSVEADEFEATAFFFLLRKGYSVQAPPPRRESDRF